MNKILKYGIGVIALTYIGTIADCIKNELSFPEIRLSQLSLELILPDIPKIRIFNPHSEKLVILYNIELEANSR